MACWDEQPAEKALVLAVQHDEQVEKRTSIPLAIEIPLPVVEFEKQQKQNRSIVRVKEIPILAFETRRAVQEDEQAEKRTSMAPAYEFAVPVSGFGGQLKQKKSIARL